MDDVSEVLRNIDYDKMLNRPSSSREEPPKRDYELVRAERPDTTLTDEDKRWIAEQLERLEASILNALRNQ